MIDLNTLQGRATLKKACILFGGIKAVADGVGVHHGNVSKWMRGEKTLSEANVSRLLEYMGIPKCEPDRTKVHEWRLKGVMRNLEEVFSLYFPDGAEMAAAPWSLPGMKSLAKVFNLSQTEIAAMTDGGVRAVIRMKAGLQVQKGTVGRAARWRGGKPSINTLDLEQGIIPWEQGPLSISEFDAAWGGLPDEKPTLADVDVAIRKEGLSFEEAIKRIRGET